MTPPIIHFFHGYDTSVDGDAPPLSFVHFVAVRSAIRINPGWDIRFHCAREPMGPHWARLRDMVTVVTATLPDDVAPQHRLVVLRLRTLLAQGGAALDLDMICQRPLDALRSDAVVMGLEWGSNALGQGEMIGLSATPILAPADAPFIRAWLASYSDPQSDLPEDPRRRAYALSRTGPGLAVRTEPPKSFNWPASDDLGLDMLFFRDMAFPDAYCLRLWEQRSRVILAGLNAAYVTTHDTTYNRLARLCLDATAATADAAPQPDAEALRLNIGCGIRREVGYLNIDRLPAVGPDLCLDIETADFPFAADSVSEVRMIHVLQFVGAGLRHAMTELFRVCRHDAVIDITVPHYSDASFLIDPLVVRRFHPEFFYAFDRALAVGRLLEADLKASVALAWNVDFVVEQIELGTMRPDPAARPRPLAEGRVDSLAFPAEPGFFDRFRDPDIRLRLRVRKNVAPGDSLAARFNAVDEAWYLARYPDVADAVAKGQFRSATEHYVWSGHDEGRMPSRIMVDEEYYLATYPDVAAAIAAGHFVSAQHHFEVSGHRERRRPHP